MNFNVLNIVVDSLRYDSFEMAKTPQVDKYFEVVKAGALATFTYPAHCAMFQGFYPTAPIDRPFYNRFSKSLFRWFYKTKRDCVVELHGQRSIPYVLGSKGVRTGCVGGVGWFNRSSPLKNGYKDFKYIPDVTKAIGTIMRYLDEEPFYGTLNIGTTHRPYNCPDMPDDLKSVKGPKSGNSYSGHEYDADLHQRQVHCMEFVDKQLATIFHWLRNNVKQPTFVCFCADHGECFGEDGAYGHGFYHPNVMNVPLGWTLFANGEAYPINKDVFKEHEFNV